MTQTSTTPTRNEYLAQIHAAARDLGYETRRGHDRRQYEAVLEVLIGRDSCLEANMDELALAAKALTARADGRRLTDVTVESRKRVIVIVTDEDYGDELERMLAGFQ